MHSWGNHEQDIKRPKPPATSEEWEAKAGCTHHHPGGGQTTQATALARFLGLALSLLYRRNQLAPPKEVSEQGHLLLGFIPGVPACVPVKSCLKDSPRTQVGNRQTALKS